MEVTEIQCVGLKVLGLGGYRVAYCIDFEGVGFGGYHVGLEGLGLGG